MAYRARITDIKVGHRLFLRGQAVISTVASVDYDAGSFVTTDGMVVTDLSIVDGWDLAGDLFNIPDE